jgi:hypothetical protein
MLRSGKIRRGVMVRLGSMLVVGFGLMLAAIRLWS